MEKLGRLLRWPQTLDRRRQRCSRRCCRSAGKAPRRSTPDTGKAARADDGGAAGARPAEPGAGAAGLDRRGRPLDRREHARAARSSDPRLASAPILLDRDRASRIQTALAGARRDDTLALSGLDPQALRRSARMSPPDVLPPDVAAELVGRSDGNPLYHGGIDPRRGRAGRCKSESPRMRRRRGFRFRCTNSLVARLDRLGSARRYRQYRRRDRTPIRF